MGRILSTLSENSSECLEKSWCVVSRDRAHGARDRVMHGLSLPKGPGQLWEPGEWKQQHTAHWLI